MTGGEAAPRAGDTLAARVDAAEAQQFVGRSAQLSLLADALAAPDAPVRTLHVHGPAGVGKSALLRAFRRLATALGVPTTLIDARVVAPTVDALLATLTDGRGPLSARPASPYLLLIDAYEELAGLDRWLRNQVLGPLPAGGVVVLAARPSARELWPGEPAWRAVVESVPLAGVSDPDAHEILRRHGVGAGASRERAVAAAGGRPLLLVLAANMLTQGGGGPRTQGITRPRDAMEHAAVKLLERVLQSETTPPDSEGSAEALLGAAALPRSFDQDLLAAMIGLETVAHHWGALMQLPVVSLVGRRYVLHDAVRGRLTAAVRRQRPWVLRRWRRRAVEHLLDRARDTETRDEAGACWADIACLATDTIWHSRINPPAESREGWRFERGAAPGDIPALLACARKLAALFGVDAGAAADVEATTERFARQRPQDFVVARDARGDVLGFHLHAPLREDTRDLLMAPVSPGLYLRALPEAVLRNWMGRTLCASVVAVAEPDAGLHMALLREFCRDFAPYERIVGVAPGAGFGPVAEAVLHVMPLLGMRPVPGFAAEFGGRGPWWAYLLDLGTTGYAQWLRSVADPAGGPLTGLDRAVAALAALEAYHDAERLLNTDAAAHFAAAFAIEPTAARMRAWIEDGLTAAGAGRPAPTGADLLRLYHLRRAGTHEALAAQCGMPRSTYFDRRRRSLERLGQELFL